MLQLKNIHKTYKTGDLDVTALKNVSLSFRDHEFVSILGPSGCGKTTLLNIIGGLDRYTSGDLVINGRSTSEYSDAEWDTYRNHSIGFVFQSYNLIPHQSVLANVELALTLSGVSKVERRQRAIRALQQVGLGDQLHKRPSQMSGGQMQRVAIARALVNEPDILLADEPTGALDTATSIQIMDLLKEISHNKLIIMVTHNPELAEQYSSRIVRLLDGDIVGDTMPYDGASAAAKQSADSSPSEQMHSSPKKGKRSMSFLTALSLSANNLLTKKGRTFMTAFAGSIGIIGIALILALSTGVQTYIDDVQRDTLSSYPITILEEETDMTSLLSSLSGQSANSEEDAHGQDAVYSNSQMYEMFNAIFNAEKTENNLQEFKKWLDAEMQEETAATDLRNYVSSIQYQYNVTLNTYVQNADGEYINTDLSKAFMAATGSSDEEEANPMYSMMSSRMTGLRLWQEILPGNDGSLVSDMIKKQYDLVYGSWPEAANEILLILDSNHEISDIAFYALGQIPQEEVNDNLSSVMKQEAIPVTDRKLSYEEICDITFKLLLNTDYYVPSTSKAGTWEYIGNDKNRMELLIENGYELKISGIVRPNEEAAATAISAPFAYTKALTSYIIEQTDQSELVQAQLDPQNENFDVLTGLPFLLTEEEQLDEARKAQEITEYFQTLTDQGKCEVYTKMLSTPPEDYLTQTKERYLEQYQTREDMENLVSSAYEMDLQTVQEYLADYTDDELRSLLEEQLTTMIQEQYAAEAKKQIEAIQNAPSEEELAALSANILSQLDDTQKQIGFVMADWTEHTSMSQEAIMAYLAALPAEELRSEERRVAAKKAAESYQQYAGLDKEAAYAKVAAVFDSEVAAATSQAILADWYDQYMPSTISGSTYADNLELLGVLDLEAPNGVNIYADTFEDKDAISKLIEQYNKTASEEHQIKYTDYVALLMSGVTGIINAVSYGLIAFVGISLVVSSIMIGIITYISVLERTKEIGILRSIGASKRDISRVFNAETVIIGFSAGAIGIIVSLLICIPINLLIHYLTGIYSINAQLPVAACIILIAISMILTLIAGLIPAGVAARKDPVEALRSE